MAVLAAIAHADEPPPPTYEAGTGANSPPSSLTLWLGYVPGPYASLALRLQTAAGMDLLSQRKPRTAVDLVRGDAARINAEARAEAFGQMPPPEIAPLYWPQGFPSQQLSDFADDIYNSGDLLQNEQANPYVIARQQVQNLSDDRNLRGHALLAAVAYRLVNPDARPEDVAWTFFKRTRFVTRAVAYDFGLPRVLKYIPKTLYEAPPQEGQVYADLRTLSYASYDSAASLTEILLTAARRGMTAVAVADRNTMAGSEDAEIVAYRLKQEGRLPADFVVIPAETVRTTTGDILALFTRSRVLDGTPIDRAVAEIHQQGGIAIDLHPGQVGEAMLLRRVPFDGYIVQPAFFEMFRTLELMGRPGLSNMMTLYAGNTLVSSGVGLLHSSIEAQPSYDSIREALLQHHAAASSALLTPWMTAAALKPIGPFEHFLNRYFVTEENLSLWLGKRIGSRYVRVQLNWDGPVKDMMDLIDLPSTLRDIYDGGSELRRGPRVEEVSVEFDWCRLVYQPSPARYFIETAFTW